MFSFKANSFRDSIKPLIFLNCFMGIGYVRHPNQSRLSYLLIDLYLISIYVINGLIIYYTFSTLSPYNIPNSGSLFSKQLRVITFYVIIATNSFQSAVAPALFFVQNKMLQDSLPRLLILDAKFHAIFGDKINMEYRQRFYRLSFQFIGIHLSMGLMAWSNFSWNPPSSNTFTTVVTMAALVQPMGVMLTQNLNLWTLMGYLAKKFQNLNNGLLQLAETTPAAYHTSEISQLRRFRNVLVVKSNRKNKNGTSTNLMNDKHLVIRELRGIYLELCKLSSEMNVCFGVQNLMTAGTSFVMITALLYGLYSGLLGASPYDLNAFGRFFSMILWVGVHCVRIWIIGHSCWRVTNEAKRTGRVVYEFLNTTYDEQLCKEMQDFSVQMIQTPVRFDACGFFNLDHTFIQGVIGTITTYLVILIQMSSPLDEISCGVSSNFTSPSLT